MLVALFMSLRDGDLTAVHCLVENCGAAADVHAGDCDMNTPLHLASR